MAETIFDSPASASLMPNLELAIVESVSGFLRLTILCDRRSCS